MKLQTKVYSGYFLTMLILLSVVLVTMWEIDESEKVSQRISELRIPTASASSTAYSGLHHSLSSLRAWMLLGKKQYKTERALAWQEEITPSMSILDTLSEHWTNPENIERLKKVKKLLIQFKTYQQEIEEVANTSANEPATDILFNQAIPLAEGMYQAISTIIELEAKQTANIERKKLFKNLANTRGSFALTLASIRAYLLSGNTQFKNKTNSLWDKNTQSFNNLQDRVALFTPRQTTAFDSFVDLRLKFKLLLPKMLSMRDQADWNLSLHWLATKAAPIGAEIGQILQQMKQNQNHLLKKDQAQIEYELNRLILIEWILMIFGIFISALTGWFLSKNIKQQVGGEPSEIVAFAKQVAAGDLDIQGTTTTTTTTTGILASLYLIADAQKQITGQAYLIAKGNYTADILPRSDVDNLSIAMQTMTQTLREVSEVAGAVAEGDLTRQVEAKSEDDLLAASMNKMIDNLTLSHDENSKRSWLQEGQVKIAEALREENDIKSLGENLLKTLSDYTDAKLGTIYQWIDATDTEAGYLELAATYAYTRRKHINQRFQLGESLVGQAAKENKIIIIEQVPEGYIQICSSLGEVIPQNLILIPFSFHDELRGVLELGFVQEIDKQNMMLLSSIHEPIGAAFENINSQMRLASSLQASLDLEAEIRTSEQRTSTIIESSLSSIITISQRGIIESCNSTAEKMFGYSKEEMVGNNVKMLMPVATAVEHDGYLKNYQETGDAKVIGSGREVVAQHKDGTPFHIHLSVTEMILDDKVSYLGTVSDITEQVAIRKEAETLLETISLNEQRTTTILETSLVSIITISTRGIIESCNATTEEFFGYSKQEMIGENVKMLMPESRAVEHDGYLKNYQDTGDAKVIGIGREVIAKRKDGSEFPMYLSVSEMQLGDSLSYLGTITDITEQVEQREKLNKANMELQASTEELASQQEELRQTNETLNNRTKELENQKSDLEMSRQDLEHKANELKESSRYKSEFLANMSHELRTPLNSLLILAKFLADNDEGNLSEDELESATVIHESGSNLLQLINDILDLSKVEAGHMTVHSDAVQLSDIQHFMESRFKHMAEAKDIVFNIDVSADMPTSFVSDYTKLGQILTNLISNALKFTEQGSVTLSLSSVISDSDQSIWLYFTVIDTGIGIPKNKQRAVFEAFQQADGSTNRQYGGTGLGLSIAMSFADLLGGKIIVESEVDIGSKFTLIIPFSEPSGDQKADPELQKVVAKSIEPLQVTLKNTPPPCMDDRDQLDPEQSLFLLIEDDAKFAKNLIKICHQQKSQMLLAPDGETGLTLAKKYKITGIILDYMLPGIDGGDVLGILQSDTATRNIPVHVISAVDELIDMGQLGAIGQLTKPVSKTQIQSVLKHLLEVHGVNEISLLVVEDDEAGIWAMKKLLSKEPVEVNYVKTGTEAIKALQVQKYNSMILDLGLPDMSGFELLQTLSEDKKVVLPPVIIYSGKDLSDEEHKQLRTFTSNSSSIIIKSVRSPERLLDEIHLFIDHVHQAQAKDIKPVAVQGDVEKLKGKHILLVDDDMRNTFSLAKVLRSKGLEVRIAPSGQDGLNALAEKVDFDLVLMDIMMPGMDGYETMQRIRTQDQFKELAIIALTANAMRGDKEKCIAAGANDYLAKPVDVDKLLVQMSMWL